MFVQVAIMQMSVKTILGGDWSVYKNPVPAIRGPIRALPRLAREILIDRLNLLVKLGTNHESMVSGELLSALALGSDGEIGNFILRFGCLHSYSYGFD